MKNEVIFLKKFLIIRNSDIKKLLIIKNKYSMKNVCEAHCYRKKGFNVHVIDLQKFWYVSYPVYSNSSKYKDVKMA